MDVCLSGGNHAYSSTTGLPTTTSAVEGATTRTITRVYDTLGRVTSYTDADGNVSTATYDLLGRPVTTGDGKGTQTRTYDPTSGLLTGLVDSQAGSFTASYDADGALTSSTLPNGLQAENTYDETGAAVRRRYTKTTSCSTACTWLDDQVTESIHGQWLDQTTAVQAAVSRRLYRYDAAGRLTRVDDTPSGQGCTVRRYGFDADSNRTTKTTHAPGTGGACNPGSTGTVEGYQYDAADRLVDPGIVYDSFGRQTAVPAAKAGGDALAITYYVDDLSRSISQGGVTKTFSLDPTGRQRVIDTSGGDGQRKTFHYADESDSPAWTMETTAGTRFSRNIEGIEGDLAAIYDSSTGVEYELSNLHGDVIAYAAASASTPTKTAATDEFGLPATTTDRRHGWLGGKQRRTETARGVIQMGVRVYVPATARFTSVDPIEAGSANDYDYANQDPANTFDLDGRESRIEHELPPHTCAVFTGPRSVRLVRGRTVVGTAFSGCAKRAWRIKKHQAYGCLTYYDGDAESWLNVNCAAGGWKGRKDRSNLRIRGRCIPGSHVYRMEPYVAARRRGRGRLVTSPAAPGASFRFEC